MRVCEPDWCDAPDLTDEEWVSLIEDFDPPIRQHDVPAPIRLGLIWKISHSIRSREIHPQTYGVPVSPHPWDDDSWIAVHLHDES